VFFGWIFTNEKRQRLLSKAADTIVIKTKEEISISENGRRYVKE
jgi:uncharacterized RDD family membrane protein YckC